MCARPTKPRHCHCPYQHVAFKPTGIPMTDLETIPVSHDELEALRLCDLLGLTQEEAGQKMGVSRGTIQRIVTVARRKVAKALVERAALVFGDPPSKPQKEK
jgi:predicted DNA-binding protein (UPF0251 family)